MGVVGVHMYTHNFCKNSGIVYVYTCGQIRIRIAYARVWGVRLRTAGWEEKGRAYLVGARRRRRPGGGRWHSPSRRHEERKGREREERKGKGRKGKKASRVNATEILFYFHGRGTPNAREAISHPTTRGREHGESSRRPSLRQRRSPTHSPLRCRSQPVPARES